MTFHLNRGLPFAEWPAKDRELWDRALGAKDFFDDSITTDWSQTTRRNMKYAYSLWLGMLSMLNPQSFALDPSERVTQDAVKEFVESLRVNCRDTTIFHSVARLRLGMGLSPVAAYRGRGGIYATSPGIERGPLPSWVEVDGSSKDHCGCATADGEEQRHPLPRRVDDCSSGRSADAPPPLLTASAARNRRQTERSVGIACAG